MRIDYVSFNFASAFSLGIALRVAKRRRFIEFLLAFAYLQACLHVSLLRNTTKKRSLIYLQQT
jgi:hypothetical protein